MQININKKPKNPDLIIGFPGWGFVGSISTNYLIEHLDCEKIGNVIFDEFMPIIAIHQGNVMDNIGIFYNKKYNIVILHFVMHMTKGMEWKINEVVMKIIAELKVKKIINLEGVNSSTNKKRILFYTNQKKEKKSLEKIGIELKDGVILGPTAALILSLKKPFVSLFSETPNKMPDKDSAVRIIDALNKYHKLNVDVKPLKKKAEEFNKKIDEIAKHMKEAEKKEMRENISYVG